MTNFTSNERCTTRTESLAPPQLSNILILSIFYEKQWKNLSKKIVSTLLYSIHAGSMMVDMLDIVEELENWDAGVGLILRGAANKSNIFCSGGDLNTVHEISGETLTLSI